MAIASGEAQLYKHRAGVCARALLGAGDPYDPWSYFHGEDQALAARL
jgi:hypothetical protein